MSTKRVLAGLATFFPGMTRYGDRGTGGTDSARYCYSVWLRHLVKAFANGLDTSPEMVIELGPGDSLGIGLAALLSGAEKYVALDAVPYATADSNEVLLDELVSLFRDRTSIPGKDDFPRVQPDIDSYAFPHNLLNKDRLERALQDYRIEKIRNSLRDPDAVGSMIRYYAPWGPTDIIRKDSVAMIISQAVLEYVQNVDEIYGTMFQWLEPGGFMSHQIDFKCHGTADEWNGHWQFSDFHWMLMKGRHPVWLNREPHSRHLNLIAKQGFEIICDETVTLKSRLEKCQLAARYRDISDADLVTSSSFIQARKPATGS